MSLFSMPSNTANSITSSAWLRSRYWTTASFVATTLAGIYLLSHAHRLHGGLMLLGAGVLLRHSLLSRRARRQAAVLNMRRAYEGTAP